MTGYYRWGNAIIDRKNQKVMCESNKPDFVVAALNRLEFLESECNQLRTQNAQLIDQMTVKNQPKERLLVRRIHYECDIDGFYSCPKADNYIDCGQNQDQCTCGADEWNAHIDEKLVNTDGTEDELMGIIIYSEYSKIWKSGWLAGVHGESNTNPFAGSFESPEWQQGYDAARKWLKRNEEKRV